MKKYNSIVFTANNKSGHATVKVNDAGRKRKTTKVSDTE